MITEMSRKATLRGMQMILAIAALGVAAFPVWAGTNTCDSSGAQGEKIGIVNPSTGDAKAVGPGLPPGTRVTSDIVGGDGCVFPGSLGTIDCYDAADPILPYRVVWDDGCGVYQCYTGCNPQCSTSWWVGFGDISEAGGSWPAAAYTRIDVFGGNLTTLRQYRDEVLNATQEGQDLVSRLYDNQYEVAAAILSHRGLAISTARLVKGLLPEVRAILDGGTGELTPTMQAQALALLAAYGENASPPLHALIADITSVLADPKAIEVFGF